jgi:hypothetical protein
MTQFTNKAIQSIKKPATYFSKFHGKTFTLAEILNANNLDFLLDLYTEINEEAQEVNIALNNAKRRAAAYGTFLKPEQFEKIDKKRRDIAKFQQPLQKYIGQLKRNDVYSYATKLAFALQNILVNSSVVESERKNAAALLADFWSRFPQHFSFATHDPSLEPNPSMDGGCARVTPR